MQINWRILDFEEINNFHLYQLLKLRSKVFVVEQNCIYQDLDDKDQRAKHIIGVLAVSYTHLTLPTIYSV